MKTKIAILLMLCGFIVGYAQTNSSSPSAPVDSSQQIASRIIESKIPVLVDFWAAWCGPCRLLNPIIEDLEKEYKGKVLFVKVDVDRHKALAQYFNVNAIPSIFIIDEKTVVSAFPGVRAKEDYKAALDQIIKISKDRSSKQNAAP